MNAILEFSNKTNNTTHKITCDIASAADIIKWYSSHYSGDDFTWIIRECD